MRMSNPTFITPLLQEHHICPQSIIHLLREGIQIERLALQIQKSTNSESVESRIKILEGERFITLLTVSCLG